MTLNEQEKVWKFSTLLPINDEYCLMIHINYFEEVVGFEVVLNLPDYLDNEIFKHKVNSMGEFTMLDKYTARVFMQIAYVFTEDDENDSYDINMVADILAYIGSEVKPRLKEFLNETSELIMQ